MEERRRNTRTDMESKLIIKRLDKNEPEELVIDIVDLSKTGVGFTSTKALMIGSVYEAYMTIWTKEVIHAFIEVVRIEKDGSTFNYGGIFVGMPEMDSQRIEVYQTFNESK
ncbi:MAG: PilZ domain-containing protein [Lachnospiraceae bacterium]|nr:PilZ domain-containing protein [Lachnospiraceae bacterium]MBQ8327457.1 PilZ domain-containing protein [Lachnospiraceae bacterium]